MLAGGVAANELLRKDIMKVASSSAIDVFYPSFSLCTDNAAMVASVGYYKLKENKTSFLDLDAISRLTLARKNY